MQATEAVPAVKRTRRQGISWGLTRYFSVEILKTTAFVLLIIELSYSLLVAIAVARNYDLDLPLALPVMWFTALSMLNDSIPLALLFATSLVYGRFVADREVMAYKSFGMSYAQILAPVVLLALCFTAGGYFINAYLVPHMKAQRRDIGGLLVSQFRALGEGHDRDFRFGNANLWIMHHDGRQLEGIFVAPRIETGADEILGTETLAGLDLISYPYCIYAERGRVLFPGEIHFEDAQEVSEEPLPEVFRELGIEIAPPREIEEPSESQIYIELEGISLFWTDQLHPGGTDSFFQRAYIGRFYFPFDPASSKRRDPGRKELTSPRLRAVMAETVALIESGELTSDGEERYRAYLAKMQTEYHDRWARMLAYFLFPVLAGLIALFLNSPNRLMPFFVSAAIVPTIYFFLAMIGQILGHDGMPAAIVMQMGNFSLVTLGVIGFFLLERKLLR
jgi:lipopolysaccharide export LptBFGC system permease protein LptF